VNGAGILAVLLATGDAAYTLEDLRRGFQTPSRPISTSTLGLILLGVSVLVVLLVRLNERRRRQDSAVQADYLSRAVQLLDLDRAEHHDLLTLARQARPPHATALLLSPANLSHAARLALKAHPDPQLRQRLDRLSVKLFGTGLVGTRSSDVQPG
jgi:hypothetical protein